MLTDQTSPPGPKRLNCTYVKCKVLQKGHGLHPPPRPGTSPFYPRAGLIKTISLLQEATMSIFAPDERRSWSLRRRRPPHEYRVIFLFFGTLFSLSTTLSDAAYPTGAADVHVTKVAAYYGPHRFHERNGLAKPENIDYSKIDRIMYGPFQLDSNGSIFVRDVNADPQLLFGPPDWNAPADAPKYCLNFAPDTQPNCAHYHYEKGLISRAHTNDVGVYLGIGGPELSENFSAMASDPGARTKVSRYR